MQSPGVIACYDPLDPTAAPPEIRESAAFQTQRRLNESSQSILKALKIGVPQVGLQLLTRLSSDPVPLLAGILPF